MKLLMLFTSLSLALTGWGIAQHQSKESLAALNEECFYYLPQLSQEEIQHCLDNLSTFILVCPEGTSLPLTLFLKGELVEMEPSSEPHYLLNIKRTFYLRYQDDQMLISLDGSNWKNWQEMLTGVISLTVGIDEKGPTLKLDTETYLRSRQEGN